MNTSKPMSVSSLWKPVGFVLLSLMISAASIRSTAATTSAASPNLWVLAYEGKSTNRFISDKRTGELIRSHVPPKLSHLVLDALGGPPDPVLVVDRRYVSVSACVSHFCPDKGFFWIDSQRGVGLGAYFSGDVLRLGSASLSSDQLPAPARHALIDWLSENELRPERVEFISRTEQTSLPAAQFVPRQRYQPPASGPSFDCEKASTQIEMTICSDSSLATQDLELAKLVHTLRQGHDTIGARQQLVTLQRKWLKARDTECQAFTDIAGCLSERYRAQYDRLMNWIPTN